MKWFLMMTMVLLIGSCSEVTDFSTCGDGFLNSGETCDGTSLGGATCVDFGFSGGLLQCTECSSFDTTQCDCTSCGSTECKDLMSDSNNCGSCGTTCLDQESCFEGVCAAWKPCGDTMYLEWENNGEATCWGEATPGETHYCAYVCCGDSVTIYYDDIGTDDVMGNPDHCGYCYESCGEEEECVKTSTPVLTFECR